MQDGSTKTRAHFVGGFVGGLTSAVALQPLDLLKTRVQQHQDGGGIMQAIRAIGHPLQLWRGTIPSAVRTSIGSALYLSSLNVIRSAMAKSKRTVEQTAILGSKSSRLPQLSMYENLFAGAFARGTVGYITMPITVIKVRYESTLYQYTSMMQATKHIYSKEGIRGFFRGFGPTCLRDAPYSGLYVLLYEKCKEWLPRSIPSRFLHYDGRGKFTTSTSTKINALSAALSASLATTITAPFDTIKTRMQLEPQKYHTFVTTCAKIIKNENFFKLFAGLSIRLSRKAFSAGIAWGIYEELIKKFI